MDFEEALNLVGLFNTYQKRFLWLFVVPVTITGAIMGMSTIFHVMTPNHWCRVPQLEYLCPSEQQLLSIPVELKNGIESFSNCFMYDVNYTQVVNDYVQFNYTGFEYRSSHFDANTKIRECSNGWIYDKTLIERSAVTELNLVCKKESWPAYILTLDGIGKIFGNPILGYIGDNYGRKVAFIVTTAFGVLSFISPIFFTNLTLFALFRFINGWILPSVYQIPHIMLMEMVGVEHRAHLIAIVWICWSIGSCLVPLAAYFSRDWVILSIVCVILGFMHFFAVLFIPESPRWLITQKKYQEAFDVLTKVAKVNGRQIPEDFRSKLQRVENDQSTTQGVSLSTLNLFTDKVLRFYVIIICLVWIANNTSYFGSLFNFQNFSGDPFVNYFLLSAIEVPAFLLSGYLMETRLGRRWTLSLCLTLAGVLYSISIFFQFQWTSAIIVASILGRCFGNVAFACVPQLAAEILPTPLRNQGMGVCSAIAALSHFVLPQVAILGKRNVRLPLLICGLTCILGGLLSTLLPETRNNNLPQSLEDCKLIKSKTKYFSLAKKEKNVEVTHDNQ